MIESDAIVFEERKGEWIAKLGVIEVGVVARLFVENKPFGAHWRCYLPGVTVTPRPARDEEEAKDRLRQAILRWIDAAQLGMAAAGEAPIRSFRQAVPL